MTLRFKNFSLLLPSLLLVSFACEDLVDDVLLADPQRSTCEAYCEWAISCHSQARDLDETAALEKCLSETRAQNDQCRVMETEGINKLQSSFYEDCTDAIDAKRTGGDCTPFTGNVLEVNSALAPSECLTVANEDLDVFNAARVATAESNDSLCERVSTTLCQRSTSCLVDEYNVPSDYIDTLDPPALERCLTQFEESVTSSCREEGLYDLSNDANKKDFADSDAEDLIPDVLYSINPNREAARACLAELEQLACGDLFGSDLPPECAGAFSDPLAAASSLNGFVCGLERDELAGICQ